MRPPTSQPDGRRPRLSRYARFWGPRAETDVDDEIRFHIDMRVRDYIARGYDEETARAAVMQRLGNLPSIRSECVATTARRNRKATRADLMDSFFQDVRFAVRTLGRQKAWSAATILTLALGNGANTAVFGVVDKLILNPLPYPDGDRVVLVYQSLASGSMNGRITVQPTVAQAWLDHSKTFESLEPFRSADLTLEQRDQVPARMRSAFVRPQFFEFAGAAPLLGRVFSETEASAAEPVVVVSEGLWRTRFGADSAVIGRSLTLNGRAFIVIGVAPATMRLPRMERTPTELWLPLRVTQATPNLVFVGRLRLGETVARASEELDVIQSNLPAQGESGPKLRALLIRPGDIVSFREPLILIGAAVALVLLIACANVVHLFLARAAARTREISIRTAIGAGRLRVFRQLLTESFIIAVAGGIAGLGLAALALRGLIALRPDGLFELGLASIDGGTLLFAIVLALASGVGPGIWGAVQLTRQATPDSLRTGERMTHAGQARTRSLLVVSQMALATTLVVGATLLVRSVINLHAIDSGFEARGLYSIGLSLPGRYDEAAKVGFYRQLVERTRALPGVEAVTLASGSPPSSHGMPGAIQIHGAEQPPAEAIGYLRTNQVDDGYFSTLGIRLLEGSSFTDSTREAGQVVVNRGFAQRYWPGESALGHRIRVIGPGAPGDWLTIVGVVADAAANGLTEPANDPILYLPTVEYYSPAVILRVTPGIDVAPSVRQVVSSLDAHLVPPTLVSVEEAMARSTERPRFIMTLLASFSVAALLLAAIGLYGIMAYTVAQRTREIGIRMALGATRLTIGRAIIVNGLVLAGIGALLGGMGAWWGTRLLQSSLYGVTRPDPASLFLAAVILSMTTLLACLVPSSRAVRVDPTIAMRAD